MSIEKETSNDSSFDVVNHFFWWDLSSHEYELTKIRPKFRKLLLSNYFKN
jgi:hypothetical protein